MIFLLIKEIDLTSRDDVKKFVEFPFCLYRDSNFWVPPLLDGVLESLNPAIHPFYKHSSAAFFIAENDMSGEVMGRLAVMNNRNYNYFNKSKTALFAYFECQDKQQVSDELFSAGIEWARNQGLTEIIGPRGLAPADGGGILIEGFNEKPIMGIPYNYHYYDQLIRNFGFEKNTDYLSGYFNRNDTLDVRYRRVAYKLAERRGFKTKEFSSYKELSFWLNRILDAHHLAFSENHTYFPPTDEEVKYLLKTLNKVVDHKLIKLVLKDDQIAGFLFCLPDLSNALKRSRGKLLPWGWYYLLREKKQTKQVNVNLIAVMPRYRGLGVLAILYASLAETFFRCGYDRLVLVTVEENNSKAINENNYLGAHWYKRHRDYKLAI